MWDFLFLIGGGGDLIGLGGGGEGVKGWGSVMDHRIIAIAFDMTI